MKEQILKALIEWFESQENEYVSIFQNGECTYADATLDGSFNLTELADFISQTLQDQDQPPCTEKQEKGSTS
jgi:hypothetical protein